MSSLIRVVPLIPISTVILSVARSAESKDPLFCLTELMLIDDGLPTLCVWLAKAQSAGNAWRGFGHSLTLEIVDGTLRHIEQ